MLVRLSVSNFALLRDAEISFKPGFTAVTGETGAGKSLLVGAIAFLAGGRAAPGVVRDGESKAVVEGEFIDSAGKLVMLRRELYAEGRTRSFLQESPVSQRRLADKALSLVDITAQRSFSHLIDPVRHLDFLDAFAGLQSKRAQLGRFEEEFIALERRISRLTRRRDEFRQRQELVRFQLGEIQSADPKPGEDGELAVEIRRLEHFEELHQHGTLFGELVESGDPTVGSLLAQASPLLAKLSGFDPEIAALRGEFESARLTLKEVAGRVGQRCRDVKFEADHLESLRERQHRLTGLARKFGGTLAVVLERRDKLIEELSAGDQSDRELAELWKEREQVVSGWCGLAGDVSRARHKSARRLESLVLGALKNLGVPAARFDLRFEMTADPEGLFEAGGKRWKLSGRGAETVEMFLSTNPGLEPRPLAQVASGGELSRLLLALKEAIPVSSGEATVLFDEIDTGVSGRIARLVGAKLKELSKGRQLIAITHLPQIAGLADQQLKVLKRTGRSGTETDIVELDDNGRIQELAALLSDGVVTKAALEQARNLISSGGAAE